MRSSICGLGTSIIPSWSLSSWRDVCRWLATGARSCRLYRRCSRATGRSSRMTKHNPDEDNTDALLRRYEIDPGRYSIGPYFSDGGTILKQQMRALNLIYVLAENNLIYNSEKKDDGRPAGPTTIGIIGGGVAGMTAAIAAARLGNNVWHFEQRPELCHLQAGCDTRWVHPRNYDW